MTAKTTAVSPGASQAMSFVGESNLTELQLLYWIGHQLRPSATHFNNAFSFTFSVPLDPPLMQQAFATAVRQYDALRTVICEEDGVPQQYVLPEPPATLEFVDLSQEANPQAAAEHWQQQRVQRLFQLDRCLYDSALLKLDEAQFVWFVNQHHLITDASSFFLLAETMLGHYKSLLRGGEAMVVAEKPTFARYAASLQKQRASSRAAKSHAFWQEKLTEKPDALHFYGRTAHKASGQVQRWIHNLGSDQTTQLIALAESADLGATTSELRQFCLGATIYFSLLHQLTGNSRLGFVTTIHNRSTQVSRQTVGVLMELCPVLVTIEPEETFLSLLQKVVAEMKQLLLHYRYGASQAASDLALDVMFTYVQRPSLSLDEQTVTHKIVHPGCGSEQLGLHIHHLADDDSYDLYLDFQLDSFTPAEQDHAKQSLKQLIAALLDKPEGTITQSSIPWPAEPAVVAGRGKVNGRSRPAFAPPSTPIETQLQQIWEEILEQSPIGVHDDFFDLGGESWRAMSFLSKFEAITGHYLPLGILLTHSTIASLAQQIESSAQTQPEAVIQIQPGKPEVPPLFVIPGAAGNTLAIDRLGQNMSPDQPVYTFQMPLLDIDNLPPAEVDELSRYYLEAMQAVQPHGPYHLSGYSAGAIFAYEVARQLKAQGERVDFLGNIDMPAPNFVSKKWQRFCHTLAQLMHLSPAREEAIYLFGRDSMNRAAYFAVRGLNSWLRDNGRLVKRFWEMPLQEKWDRLRNRRRDQEKERKAARATRRVILRDMDPSSLTDPRARALFDLYDRAARKYFPQPYDGRLTLLRCPLGHGRKEIRSAYPHYGWQHLVGHLETHTINAPGHLALLHEPAVTEVAQTLQLALSKVIEKGDS